MATRRFLLSDLRFALRHLYEPRLLQTSPLLGVLAADDEANPTASLRVALTRAIEGLKPGLDARPQSPARRGYEILYYRYVQQCTLEEVTGQLGLSMRHLKREQRKAMERLAQYLAERYDLEIDLGDAALEALSDDGSEEDEPRAAELQWSGDAGRERGVALASALPAVLDLVQPIVARYDTRVQVREMEGLPPVAVDVVALRQTLLSVLCVAIRCCAGGKLVLSAQSGPGRVDVRLRGCGAQAEPGLAPEDTANLDVARSLLRGCGGQLSVHAEASSFLSTLWLPAVHQVAVLVVDDHADAVQLLQRYVTGSPYRIWAAGSAEEALALVAEVNPQIIVLDVMMPDVDGWELLRRLKQNQATRSIPIVACTVVAQEELALALGVSAFLRKPVSRRDFLSALDRLAPRARR